MIYHNVVVRTFFSPSALVEMSFPALFMWSGDQLPVLSHSASTEIVCQVLKENSSQHTRALGLSVLSPKPWRLCLLSGQASWTMSVLATFSRLMGSMGSAG